MREHRNSTDGRRTGAGSGERLTIAFVNNMPDAAVRSSERQFCGLLKAAAGGLDVDVKNYVCADVPRTEIARQTFLQNYRNLEELFDEPVDGLIVTGAEPRAASIDGEPYWPSLARLIDWAGANTVSTIWSCLAAHAAVYRLSGIARKPMGAKLSGLYECSKTLDHSLTAGTPQSWRVPHSRYNDLRAEELMAADFQPITTMNAGFDTFISLQGSLFVFFQGHPEYDPESLLLEYLRDVKRFIERKRDVYPNAPSGYFDDGILQGIEDVRRKIVQSRQVSCVTELSKLLHSQKINYMWRSPSVTIFSNWLQYIANQKYNRTPASDEIVAA